MNRAALEQVASMIEATEPEKAAAIRQQLADLDRGRREGLNISIGITYKLQKFDGEFVPGKQPVEIIEGADVLS